MNAYEQVALNEYLSEYPKSKTYDEVLGLLLNEDKRVLTWEPFESRSPDDIYDLIEALKDTLEKHFVPRKEEKQ